MKTLIATIATVLLTAGAAGADDSILVGNQTTKTEISGHTGAERYLGFSPRDDAWFFAIGWSERNDQPCFARLYGASYKRGAWQVGWHKNNVAQLAVSDPKRELALCEDKPASLEVAGAALGAKPDVVRVIRGIAVCTSERKKSADERLKGIRVWSSQLDVKTGKLSSEEANEHAYRTHCKTWHPRRSCPEGQGAIGLRVIHAREGLRGLGLVCAPFSKGMTRPDSN